MRQENSIPTQGMPQDAPQGRTEPLSAEHRESEGYLDAIRGCLLGGAVGDALGYPVEFLREAEIFEKYGPKGITAYTLDPRTGKALISDDTQMSLFTVNGLLVGDTRGALRGIRAASRAYVAKAYLDWYKTQSSTMEAVNRHKRCTEAGGFSWLLDVPELYARRAPGSTCLSALREGREYEDYLEARRNRSKGCGGVMRVAPLALDRWYSEIEDLDLEGAQLAAITHGHSLGYMPAAVLVHILRRVVFPWQGKRMSLKEIVLEARDTAARLFAGDPYLGALLEIIDRAVLLSENERPDLENIRQLGEGWVAEETLGIALYCALRHQTDFSAGVIAAVNHGGDSDSTGAVTGSILGALLGEGAIDRRWREKLELSDLILELADDLCHGCRVSGYSVCSDPAWEEKYVKMHRPDRV